jgi:hypothetical protein
MNANRNIEAKHNQVIKLLIESNLSNEFVNKIQLILSTTIYETNKDELTKKEIEAIEFVDDFLTKNDKKPGYRDVASGLKISKTAAYARLRNYRHKMKAKLNVSGEKK